MSKMLPDLNFELVFAFDHRIFLTFWKMGVAQLNTKMRMKSRLYHNMLHPRFEVMVKAPSMKIIMTEI